MKQMEQVGLWIYFDHGHKPKEEGKCEPQGTHGCGYRIGKRVGAWLENKVPVCAEGGWAARGACCSLSSMFL